MNLFRTKFIDKIIGYKESSNSAICVSGISYTYAQLFDFVEQIYEVTDKLDQEIIGLYAADDIRTYATIIALWLQGKTYVPLNPTQPIDRHIEIINSVNIKYIISPEISYKVEQDGVVIIFIDTISSERYFRKDIIQVKDVSDDKLAYILFTSGSTGKPKGVQISRGNLAAFIDSMDHIGLNITSEDRCLQPFDLTFDFSISSYVIPLVKGACLYTIPNKAVKFTYIAELLEKYNLTVLQMVPSMIRNLLPYLDEIDLSSVKYNIICGEALTAKAIEAWHKGHQDMVSYNMYGPTENTVFCTFYKIGFQNLGNILCFNDVVSIGKTFDNSDLIVMNDNMQVVTKSNENGELCLCGAQLTPGYWRNEQENQEKFFFYEGKKYYRTGDLCHYGKDRNLMFISRMDYQIKINGYRVELGEIESLYSEASNGRLCIVMPYQNSQDNTELAIIIEGKEYDYSADKEYLNSKLPKYMFPSKWFFIKSMPLNQNGKVDRKSIVKIFNL